MQEPESVGAEGVDDCVQIDLADALEAPHEEGVGRQQFSRRASFHMPFLEARIELLQEGRLLGRDLDDLLGVPGLQRQPALDLGAQAVVVEELLDRDRRDPVAFQGKPIVGKTVPRTVF